MSRPLVVSIPHNLGQAEAASRLRTGIAGAKARFSGSFSVVEEKWTDDHLDFHITALRQDVRGMIDVEPAQVRLSVELPWALSLLAEKVKALISKQGSLMLEKK